MDAIPGGAIAHDHTIFVYGSLRAGGSNHHLLATSRLLRVTTTAPAYQLVDLGPYPALVAGGQTAVVGEIYAVTAAVLADLDELEEHPDVYQRLPVHLADGTEVEGYLMPAARVVGLPRVVGGDWMRHGVR